MVPAFLARLERRLSLTREGLAWLGLSLGMLATGLIKGINLIPLLGCILIAVGTCNLILARRQLAGVRAARQLPDFAVAGTGALWRVRLWETRHRTRLGLRLHDPGLGQPAEWFVDVLPRE